MQPHPRPRSAILVGPASRRHRPPLNAEALAHISLIGLFAFAVIAALWLAQAIVVPVAAAIVVGLVLGPVVDRLMRLGLPEWAAAAVVLVAATIAVHLVLAACALPLLGWIDRAPEVWSAVREKLAPLKSAVVELGRVTTMVERATGLDQAGAQVAIAGPGVLGNVASVAPAMLAQLVIFAATLFFFLATRRSLRRAIFGLCLSRTARLTAARVFADAEFVLSRYFGVITLINLGLGVATAIVAALFGLPTPALWGVIAAILNFAPYVGPAIVTGVLFAVGLASLDSIWSAALMALAFVGLNTLEGQIVTPMVLGRRLTLNPLMIFLAIAVWLWLWGPVGAFIAVPSLLVASIVVDRLSGGAGRRFGRLDHAADEPAPPPARPLAVAGFASGPRPTRPVAGP